MPEAVRLVIPLVFVADDNRKRDPRSAAPGRIKRPGGDAEEGCTAFIRHRGAT
jgi:hypothetical protein